MIHPVIVNPVISPLGGALDPVAWLAGGSWPSGLLKLYRSTDGTKAALGSISWDGTPTITDDGVATGNGPDMGTVNRASRKVCVVRFKATKASTGITGDEQVFGPLYLRNGNLVGKLDGQEGVKAHTWAVGDEIDVALTLVPGAITVNLVSELEARYGTDDR